MINIAKSPVSHPDDLYFNTKERIYMIQEDIEKSNIDYQLSVARKYPRDIQRSIDNAIIMATMSMETAQSCGYALIKEGKPIVGPSVHLARIVASCWGNIRTDAKVVQTTEKQIISRGTCWDLETNVSSSFDISRSIIGKTGKRFSNDVITATGNATNSIAYRNAVFAVVPRAVVDQVYQAALNMITGDLSDEGKLKKKRTEVLNIFKSNYKIKEQDVLNLCGRQELDQINTSEIALLLGILQSLKDGDTTVNDLIPPKEVIKEDIVAKKKKMKTKKVDKLP